VSLRGTAGNAAISSEDSESTTRSLSLLAWRLLHFVRNDTRLVKMKHQYYVYILSNKNNTTLYTGVTNDLKRRVFGHKNKLVDGFSKRYNLTHLVYYEMCSAVESAILREKQLKAGSRQKKINLINTMNPEWRDLYDEI
jgi:putative endonuclease